MLGGREADCGYCLAPGSKHNTSGRVAVAVAIRTSLSRRFRVGSYAPAPCGLTRAWQWIEFSPVREDLALGCAHRLSQLVLLR